MTQIISTVKKIFSSPLSRQYLTWIFFFGTVLSLIITTTEIYNYYQRLHNELEGNLERISSTYIDALGSSLWEYHDSQAQLIMDGITLDSRVQAVEVKDERLSLTSGNIPQDQATQKIEKNIIVNDFNSREYLGKFIIYADLNWLHQQVYDFALARLLNNFTKSIVVILFAFFAFWILVNKYLKVISHFVSSGKTLKNPVEPLKIERNEFAYRGQDEIDDVVSAINHFGKELQTHISKVVTMTRDAEIVNQRLIEAMRMESLGKQASSITHEFNNSLAIISGSIELIAADEKLSEEVRQRLRVAESSVNTASQLTKQLLQYARKNTSAVSLLQMDVFSKELEMMLNVFVAKGNNLVVLCMSQQALYTNKEMLMLSIINLVKNANDALINHGEITVIINELSEHTVFNGHLSSDERYIEISVIDNGPGLTEVMQNKLFEPFMTTKSEGKGSGLGLWTVHNFIQQLSGAIIHQQADGGGCHFRIAIPVILNPPLSQEN